MAGSEEGRRETHREGVIKSAKIVIGSSVVNCVVLDVSEKGARVRMEAMTVLPKQVTLCFRGGAGFLAELRWARGQEVGFEFLSAAALTSRKATEMGAVLQALRGSGFDPVLATLQQARHFDDPALAHVAQQAREAVARLAATMARLAKADLWEPPDVFE